MLFHKSSSLDLFSSVCHLFSATFLQCSILTKKFILRFLIWCLYLLHSIIDPFFDDKYTSLLYKLYSFNKSLNDHGSLHDIMIVRMNTIWKQRRIFLFLNFFLICYHYLHILDITLRENEILGTIIHLVTFVSLRLHKSSFFIGSYLFLGIRANSEGNIGILIDFEWSIFRESTINVSCTNYCIFWKVCFYFCKIFE